MPLQNMQEEDGPDYDASQRPFVRKFLTILAIAQLFSMKICPAAMLRCLFSASGTVMKYSSRLE